MKEPLIHSPSFIPLTHSEQMLYVAMSQSTDKLKIFIRRERKRHSRERKPHIRMVAGILLE